MTCIYHQQDEEEGFDIVEKDGKSYNIGEMLHGCCDLFALELGKKLREKNILFQYGIMVNEEGLVHAFLFVDSEENIFIDVRGMTTDEEEFFEEFADFFSYKSLEYSGCQYLDFISTEKDFKKALKNLWELNYQSFVKYINDVETRDKAQEIIEAFPEMYIL